jgi:hypothetical protein
MVYARIAISATRSAVLVVRADAITPPGTHAGVEDSVSAGGTGVIPACVATRNCGSSTDGPERTGGRR